MAGIFLVILIFSFIVALALRFIFPLRFNNLEVGMLFIGSLILGGIFIAILSYNSTADFDILNGQVTGKTMERVSCRHSYQCMCVNSCDSKGNCSQICQTCYEHSFDQDWDVFTNVGNHSIDTVDSQGLIEPKRWTDVKVGEPASAKERVTNYILASPQSLFNTKQFENDDKLYGKWIPAYNEIYDYYRFDHVKNVGIPNFKEINPYNDGIANILRKIGPAKQANINLIFVPTDDREYKNALERHWLGGKKNDIIVVIGVKDYPKIAFADAFSFARSSQNEMLMIKLQQDIEEIADVSKVNDVVNAIDADVSKYFSREHMSKFSYLKDDYVPSGAALFWCGLIYIIILGSAVTYFWYNDVTMDGTSSNRFSNNYRYSSYTMDDIRKMHEKMQSKRDNSNNPYRRIR